MLGRKYRWHLFYPPHHLLVAVTVRLRLVALLVDLDPARFFPGQSLLIPPRLIRHVSSNPAMIPCGILAGIIRLSYVPNHLFNPSEVVPAPQKRSIRDHQNQGHKHMAWQQVGPYSSSTA